LNSVLGLVLTSPGLPPDLADGLRRIQNDLFDLGADLCVPETDEPRDPPPLRVSASQVASLETRIDEAVAKLKPLNSFILPGGTPAAAHLHLARTVCRRVEIEVLQLAEFEEVNPQVNIYLNRLSDLLFVWARVCNDHGARDILWIPGENRDEPAD
jgi:cob(I)alamin adenosyltransferase